MSGAEPSQAASAHLLSNTPSTTPTPRLSNHHPPTCLVEHRSPPRELLPSLAKPMPVSTPSRRTAASGRSWKWAARAARQTNVDCLVRNGRYPAWMQGFSALVTSSYNAQASRLFGDGGSACSPAGTSSRPRNVGARPPLLNREYGNFHYPPSPKCGIKICCGMVEGGVSL